MVFKNSQKIKVIMSLLNEFNLEKIANNNRRIIQQEYSRKSLDRVNRRDLVFYNFDNNIDNIVDDVIKLINNIQKKEKLCQRINNINVETDINIINRLNLSKKKFSNIQEKIVSKILNDKSFYEINVYLKVYYRSPQGKVNISKEGKINSKELLELYKEWKNTKKYSINAKIERSIMNDSIRYNVLKRDNYTCQICGATSKDGAKLHVDHIIPISKGGKTVMSNLQTLCERCNLGKSNKTDENFFSNMICPKCGSKLVERNGKYGKFIGCSNYPNCHYKHNN